MGEMEEEESKLAPRVEAFIQRLYRDPRYLIIGKLERFGREFVAFVEGCSLLSPGGEVRGQALLNTEYALRGRPDGQHPFGRESLLDFHLSSRAGGEPALAEDDLMALREESWQYYVRRNFAFLLQDFAQAREDAEHNLGIWNLIDQSQAADADKWTYLKWWPWIERDRALAQAFWDLQHGNPDHAATELYRAERSIQQFGQNNAPQYAQEEGDGVSLCLQMAQHIAALVKLLRDEHQLPVSLEEKLDQASGRGDAEEVERLRAEMIRRTMEEGED
jgi:hypothetical protein